MPKISRFIAQSYNHFLHNFSRMNREKSGTNFYSFLLLYNFPVWGVNKHWKLGVSDSKYANELAQFTAVIVELNLNPNDFNLLLVLKKIMIWLYSFKSAP